MAVFYHIQDLPANLNLKGDLAIDTEAMGLIQTRDRLCVVQISNGNGDAHIVHFQPKKGYDCPVLIELLSDGNRTKIFHFARFDVAALNHYLKIELNNIYCTKIASRLTRTYTENHGLKDLCNELLGIKISKQQQSSDWGSASLTKEQIDYAASDVLYLHKLKQKLDVMLLREGRMEIAKRCFAFLGTRAKMDLEGFAELDIFHH